MAYLNPGSILSNPMISSPFVVKRRAEVVAAGTGRGAVSTRRIRASGVVCGASPNDLKRLPEGDRAERYISVVSNFQFRGPSKDASGAKFKPDLIEWGGNDYLVADIVPYPQYGEGFSQTIAGSTDILEEAPE